MCGLAAGTAAALLYVAYVLYRWGNRIGSEQQQQQQEQQYGFEDDKEVFEQPAGYEPWKLDDFVQQEGYVEQEGYGTPLAVGDEGEEVSVLLCVCVCVWRGGGLYLCVYLGGGVYICTG